MRGRGVPMLYVTPDMRAAVVARCTVTRNGKRWHFQRFGKLTRREIEFLHTLNAAA